MPKACARSYFSTRINMEQLHVSAACAMAAGSTTRSALQSAIHPGISTACAHALKRPKRLDTCNENGNSAQAAHHCFASALNNAFL